MIFAVHSLTRGKGAGSNVGTSTVVHAPFNTWGGVNGEGQALGAARRLHPLVGTLCPLLLERLRCCIHGRRSERDFFDRHLVFEKLVEELAKILASRHFFGHNYSVFRV